ncbi:MAG: hypothetical protein SCK70_04785 [bacterium]|nr:hypothetical protein [bacterium]
MDAYLYNLITGLIKAVLLFWVFFVWLPKFFFEKESFTDKADRTLSSFVLLLSYLIILVHLLAASKIYDILTLVTGFLLFWALAIWLSNRTNNMSLLSRINYSMLKLMESDRKNFMFYSSNISSNKDNQHNYRYCWSILAGMLLLLAGALRLKPVLTYASPFSGETYITLEYVKQLQNRALFHDQNFVAKGMHSLIDVLFQFSRTDAAIFVHIFSALAAVLLVYIIYYSLTKFTDNPAAGLIGASIFGVFTRLLPINIQQQVEANTIVVSMVFLYLSLFYIQEYLIYKNKIYLIVFGTGAVTAGLISPFALFMIIIAIIPLLLAYWLCYRQQIFQSKIDWLRWLIPIALLCGTIYQYYQLSQNILVAESIRIALADEAYIRFNQIQSIFTEKVFFHICLSISVILILMTLLFLQQHKRRLNYLFQGLYLLLLSLLWQVEIFGIPDILNKSQVAFMVSVQGCLSIGLILHHLLFEQLIKWLPNIKQRQSHQTVYRLLILLLLFEPLLILKTPVAASFNYTTEPEGFSRSLYKIQQQHQPYEWTVVSHGGAKAYVQNRGRYMDYNYFLKYFQPKTFYQKNKNPIPTKYLFIFTEKDPFQSRIDSELLPNISELTVVLNDWCSQYQQFHSNMDVYFEDDLVRIFRITFNSQRHVDSATI